MRSTSNENRAASEASEGQLEAGESVQAQNGRRAKVGSFVTSKFAEFKTGAQDKIESATEKIRSNPKTAKLATGMAVLALAGGAAEQATGGTEPAKADVAARSVAEVSGGTKYMKPRAIKQFLFRRAATYNNNNDMRPTRLVLTQDKLEMKGRCNPKNPYNPLFKFWKNAPHGTVGIACGETKKYVTINKPPIYDGYIKVVDNLGGKLARHAGVADSQRGKPTSIVATNRFTKLKFDNSGGPVDAILFRTQGKPIIYK